MAAAENLVASLNRPDDNLTGTFITSLSKTIPKRLELLPELLPPTEKSVALIPLLAAPSGIARVKLTSNPVKGVDLPVKAPV